MNRRSRRDQNPSLNSLDADPLPAPAAVDRWLQLLPLVLLSVVAVLLLGAPTRIDHDCAMYLQAGQLLLEGEVPYVDFIDLNPPFIIYLNAIPAFAAQVLGLPLIPTFSSAVLLLALWSTLAVRSSLARQPSARHYSTSGASAWAVLNIVTWSAGEFGQREHLLLLLYMPYLLTRAASSPAPPLRRGNDIMLGFAAGCALCLKPQYLLAALVLEAYWLKWPPRWRALFSAAPLTVAATLLLYGGHFMLLPQAARAAFFDRWMPLVASHYNVYDVPFSWLLTVPIALSLCIAVWGMIAALRATVIRREILFSVALFALIALCIYAMQHKGWTYHRLPAFAAVMLIGAMVLRDAVARSRSALLATLIPVGAAALWLAYAMPGKYLPPATPFTHLIERHTAPRAPVLIVSTSVTPAYPSLVQTDRRPGSRYLWFFPIPMLLAPQAGGEIAPSGGAYTEQIFLAELVADIEQRQPPLILIQATEGCQGCPRGFNVNRYLGQVEVFSRQLLAHYTQIEPVRGFAVWVRSS